MICFSKYVFYVKLCSISQRVCANYAQLPRSMHHYAELYITLQYYVYLRMIITNPLVNAELCRTIYIYIYCIGIQYLLQGLCELCIIAQMSAEICRIVYNSLELCILTHSNYTLRIIITHPIVNAVECCLIVYRYVFYAQFHSIYYRVCANNA